MNQKLNITILIDQLIAGGVQKTAIEEVKNLTKMGYNTKLLVLTKTGFSYKNKELAKNIDFEFLSDRYPKILQNNFKIPYFKFLTFLHLLTPFLAIFYIKRNETNLIISHGTTTSFTTLALSHFNKIPYFIIVYDPLIYILEKVYKNTPLKYIFPPTKLLCSFIERKIIANSVSCFVISSLHFKYLKSTYNIKPTIIYLGINPPKKIPKNYGDKILLLGRWEKEKNIEEVLDLASQIPNSQFIIAGSWTDQSYLNWFKNEIKHRKISRQIEIITHFEEKDLLKIIQKSSFWIHLNLEAFSLSALEAASYGLPIILPKESGVSELFQNGKHGFFPKNNDKKAFLEHVDFLKANKNIARQMGKNAAKVTRIYTWQKHTKILAIYINKFFNS